MRSDAIDADGEKKGGKGGAGAEGRGAHKGEERTWAGKVRAGEEHARAG